MIDQGILWEILSDKGRKASLTGAFEEIASTHDRYALQQLDGKQPENAAAERKVAVILRGVIPELEKLAKK